MIVARVDGDAQEAKKAVESIEAIEGIDIYDQEVSIRVANGAGFISAVALALNASSIRVRELTLRTPVTGGHLQQEETVNEVTSR